MSLARPLPDPVPTERVAFDVRVGGVVQGVGFRPFVHRLALRYGLDGWVRNESGIVHVRIEGAARPVRGFLEELQDGVPQLARIEQFDAEPVPAQSATGFAILPSTGALDRHVPVPPDVTLCDDCIRELRTPRNRRFRYPFTTCTDCGPRYTVVRSLPYDRARTSMAAFTQCAACAAEYGDPADRRHHSQTNACPTCGPRLTFVSDGARTEGEEAVCGAAQALLEGRTVAVRGVGGFHLAVDATNEYAVARLRDRKDRDAKPFAVMVADIETARALAHVGDVEAATLRSPARPIVLTRARPESGLAGAIAPGLDTVGLMLAYTPVHVLLLDAVARPLVMTSGNRGGDAIAAGNDEALVRLGAIADAFLLHDREIVARCDDSVIRMVDAAPVLLRRARGYVPGAVPLPIPAREPILAVGPHLKNTFTIAIADEAHVSPHIGDLETLETLNHFEATLRHHERLTGVSPRTIARDLHPGYLSTQIAEMRGGDRLISVQHHHAHIAAVAAEHGVTEPVVGLAFDGTGLGDDGTIWGAEVLVCDLAAYRRVGGLRSAPMPGGDLAARRPWRAALGYLSRRPDAADAFRLAFDGIDEGRRDVAEHQIGHGINAPLASSMGRLFDAAAAVLGVRRRSSYEGQAAMELEALVAGRSGEPVAMPVSMRDGRRLFDPLPVLIELGERARRGHDMADLAAAFHASIARAAIDAALAACDANGIATVALGGGTFQNAILLSGITAGLRAEGVRVIMPRLLGPNDGAISYGQAAVAAALLEREK